MQKNIIITVFIATCLASCTSTAYKQGVAIADELRMLKVDADFRNLPQIISKYNNIEDSICAIDASQLQDFNNGIFESIKGSNDTINIVSHVVIDSPTSYGLEFAQEVVEGITKDKLKAPEIAKKIAIIHYIYKRTREESSNVEFNNSFQSHIDLLSTNDQMLVYTKISTPAALAHAIADDIEHGNNIDKSNQQIDAIKKIYLDGTKENILFFETLNKRLSTIKQGGVTNTHNSNNK